MDDNEILSVPYIVYESAMARAERNIRRLFIALIAVVACLLLSNLAWLYYESQFETYTYEQDGEGVNNLNYFGRQGDLNVSEIEGEEEEEK